MIISFFKKLFCKNEGIYDETNMPQKDSPVVDMPHQKLVEPFEGIEPVGSESVAFNEQKAIHDPSLTNINKSTDGALALKENFEKLLMEQAELAKNYDRLAAQLEGDSRELLLDVVQKTIDSMILAGCKPIVNEPTYDMSRHRPEPFTLAAPGTPIQRTLRQGIEWQGKVYIPAVVEL